MVSDPEITSIELENTIRQATDTLRNMRETVLTEDGCIKGSARAIDVTRYRQLERRVRSLWRTRDKRLIAAHTVENVAKLTAAGYKIGDRVMYCPAKTIAIIGIIELNSYGDIVLIPEDASPLNTRVALYPARFRDLRPAKENIVEKGGSSSPEDLYELHTDGK